MLLRVLIYWCFLLNERPNTHLTHPYIGYFKTFLLRVAALDLFNHNHFDVKNNTGCNKCINLCSIPVNTERVRGLAL